MTEQLSHKPEPSGNPLVETNVIAPALGITSPMATLEDIPVVLYLPAISNSPANTSSRVADLMARKLTAGSGSFISEVVPLVPSAKLQDGWRISRSDSTAILDIFTLDYRPLLQLPEVGSKGLGGALQRLFLALWYFARIVVRLWSANRRAKTFPAKLQLLIGFGAAGVMLACAVFTGLAVLASLGLWTEPSLPENLTDALAISGTAATTWLWLRARPIMARWGTVVEQMMDYAEDERHGAGVGAIVETAIDDILEATPKRKVYLFGYSLGALIAMDFLFPRRSLQQPLDPRHNEAISGLITVGCPIDFVRLFLPEYHKGRDARVTHLDWLNIFIPADVLGSNYVDGDDNAMEASSPEDDARAGGKDGHKSEKRSTGTDAPASDSTIGITVAGHRPTSLTYTSAKLNVLNVWSRKGFLSHAGYWDEPERENCLHLVLRRILPATGPHPSGLSQSS